MHQEVYDGKQKQKGGQSGRGQKTGRIGGGSDTKKNKGWEE